MARNATAGGNMTVVGAPADLQARAEALQTEQAAILTDAKTQQAELQAKLDQVNALIASIEGTEVETNGKPGRKRGRPAGSTGAKRGPRGNNKMTIKECVIALLKKHKAGLGRSDITSKILEMGYETNSSPEDFSNSVYTSGINKLVAEGAVESVGTRPNTVYVLKK